MRLIIGIAGPAQAGKSTLAGEFRRLVEFRGLSWHDRPFAGPLKAMLALIGVDVSEAGKNTPDPRSGNTPRQMMQTLGTEWGRALHDDFWVRVWASQLPREGIICAADVRFDNEADYVRGIGGIIIHVNRPMTHEMLAVPAHASENGIKCLDGDLIINNDRGIEKLAQFAGRVFDRFYK